MTDTSAPIGPAESAPSAPTHAVAYAFRRLATALRLM